VLKPGQIFGPYHIVRPLGQGGMGRVYEAEDSESGRRVAIKLMGHSLGSENDRARFLREGRLAASINHPNSVYIYGTMEIGGIPVIAMELSAEGTLKDRIVADGPMEPCQAVDTALQLIEGLEAASGQGILHRDIKPANCFVDSAGRVKVGDYGLSISTTAGETVLTVAGTMLGTPAFSSPEQLRGQDLDIRSDIYSLGATLYYLLTGRPPFEEKGMANLMAAVLERVPDTPHSLRSEIPKSLSTIVLRCLNRQSALRWGDYAALREALLPFGSTRLEPAGLTWRAAASLIDSLPVLIFSGAAGVLSGATQQGDAPDLTEMYSMGTLLATLLVVTYFGISEGIWGASVGKWLLHLRVVGPGGGIPGIARAWSRALAYSAIPLIPGVVIFTVGPELDAFALRLGVQASSTLLFLALFVTVRRKNGFAAVHGLLSGTRVVVKHSRATRSSAQPETAVTVPV